MPNFSEGRNAATIAALRAALQSVPAVALLDVQVDGSHNRSVFTLVAPPEAAIAAAFRAMQVATERIDLRVHQGEHPRMGATDVVPFVPIHGVTMDECVALARALAARAGAELEIPIYLYGRAATRPDRERLPDVRKGEFEGLRERLGRDPAADPDYGPRHIHPTAGATAIGARPFLVAFNVYLDTSDVAVAKAIARQIRSSSGGFAAVQASGFAVEGRAQVSMNLLDIDTTAPAKVFAAIAAEAQRRGLGIVKSEVVGLIPERALLDAAAAHLKLDDPGAHLLEAKIREHEGPTLEGFLGDLAAASPTPGGGSAAALVGAVAGALVAMVARLTIGRKGFADAADRIEAVLAEAEEVRERLRSLVDEDAAAYRRVRSAYTRPREDPARRAVIDAALVDATQPPVEVARHAARLLVLAREIGSIGNQSARSDASVAELLARAALAAAVVNVRVNIAALSDATLGAHALNEAERLERDPGL